MDIQATPGAATDCKQTHHGEQEVNAHLGMVISCLGGGFKYFLFSPLLGEASHFDQYFSNGFKPPISCGIFFLITLQGTKISPPDKAYLKMIFLFPRWDMLVSWKVVFFIQSSKFSFESK